jgi:demethylmenaquinone methyltransferase/2-methoxy-6-polyprenyl-1,4-benzoquinol methylase
MDKSRIVSSYGAKAKWFDRATLLCYCIGFRHHAYRRRAVQALGLKEGDTVVDLGCGTGLNFPLLQAFIGPRGTIVGVDMTDGMLDEARARVTAQSWRNVELVKSDVANYVFRKSVDGVLSTFLLALVPEYDQVVRNVALALAPGRRFVILDLERPSGRLMSMAAPALGKALTRLFGGGLDLVSRKPWKSLEEHLTLLRFEKLYFGGAYIASGQRADRTSHANSF